MVTSVKPTRRKKRPNCVIQLIPTGPLAREIGKIALRYGQELVAIGETGLFAKAEPHKWGTRVGIFALGSGFGEPLPVKVRLYLAPGDDIGYQGCGFYFYLGMHLELKDQTFFRLEYPTEE